jgi:hypothetical protein
MLYDYLLICGMDFLKAYERFKQTVIDKAYELKQTAPDKTDMVTSINKVLTALDVPLVKPALAVIATMPRYTCDNTKCPIHGKKAEEAKPTTEPSKAANTVVQPAANKDTAYNPDMTLFIALAKKHDAKNAVKNPIEYFSYYERAVKWGSVTGATKADKINEYLSRWSDGSAREDLMKSLFTKNNLVFSDVVMTLYEEWQKEYKPTGATNRYKKMCAFIDAHKTLFTA